MSPVGCRPSRVTVTAVPHKARTSLTEEEIRAVTVGELNRLDGRIVLTAYDPEWPAVFARQADIIRTALGNRALLIEHVGSTAVPELMAKPIVDMLLAVANSADEAAYVPDLEAAGLVLRIRERDWHEHRMLKRRDPAVHVHVFSSGCPEIERMVRFRDWLRRDRTDRDLYARTKQELAQRVWRFGQNYADAKTPVVREIIARAKAAAAVATPVTTLPNP